MIPKLFLFSILTLLALSCGGGGDESTQTSSLRIKMINANLERGKLAVFDEDTQFRIFSDQNVDRTNSNFDPIEATHIRVSFLSSDGNLLLEQEEPIIRYSTAPYEVDPDQRFVKINNPPSGNLTIKLELGQDFNLASTNTQGEVIYYSGQTNLILSGNVAIIDNVETNTIPIAIRNFFDPDLGYYSVQGYLDFTDYPVVLDNEIDETITIDPDEYITSFVPRENNFLEDHPSIGNTNYISNHLQIADISEPLSYFFEIFNISDNFTGFTVASQLGAPYNYVIRGYVPPSESQLGFPVVIDWETTWTKIMTDWFVFSIENGYIDNIPTDDFEEIYNAMGNAFRHVEDIFQIPLTGGNTISEPYVLNAQDLVLTEITYDMLTRLNAGDTISDTSLPVNFHAKTISLVTGTKPTNGVNHFFFSEDGIQRQLSVTIEYSDEILYIPTDPSLQVITASDGTPVLDSSDEFIVREPVNGEFALNDLYTEKVEDISFEIDSILAYLYLLMFETP